MADTEVFLTRLKDTEDLARAAELEQACFSDPWTFEMIKGSVSAGYDIWLILKKGQQAAGYLAFRILSGEGELFRLGVAPAFRGRGYGKKLMDGMVEYARKNQVAAIVLEVRESNEKARSLYKSYGFREQCIRKDYYRKPKEAAVLMINSGISNIYH